MRSRRVGSDSLLAEVAGMAGRFAMTYQDPTVRNPNDPWRREWSTGSVITTLVAIVIMAGIIACGTVRILKYQKVRIARRCIIARLVKVTPVLSKIV